MPKFKAYSRDPICIFHRNDFDGLCSGAIVKKAIPDVELFGWDYGDDIPWDKLEGRDVIMVDICFKPFSKMAELAAVSASLTWIDHHVSAISEYEKSGQSWPGLRQDGTSACELTWMFFFSEERMPETVNFLGRYDVWDHADPNCLLFQYGLKARIPIDGGKGVHHSMWKALLTSEAEIIVDDILCNGGIVKKYQEVMNAEHVAKFSYPALLETSLGNFFVLACNTNTFNSQLFNSVWDPEKYEFMVAYCRMPDGRWKFSLYTDREDRDGSKVAESFGGGGHKGASGFILDELPEGTGFQI